MTTNASRRRISGMIGAVLLASLGVHASAQTDPIVMFDGFDGCAPVQATIDAQGGSLRLCGAQLVVPAGAVDAPTVFGIERLDVAPPAPFDMEAAGAAFRFTPDDVAFAQSPSVRVPREDERRGGLAVFVPVEESLVLIEACQHSVGGVQQFVDRLGTFAAVRWQGVLPLNTQGLGDGQVHATAGGVATDYDLDAPGNNYAIHQDRPDGGRSITISAMREGDAFEFLRLDLGVDAAGTGGDIVQVSQLGSVSGSFIAGLLGEASITFGDLSDGRVRATVTATLANGSVSVPFEATFDIASERYVFPPALSCPGFPPG